MKRCEGRGRVGLTGLEYLFTPSAAAVTWGLKCWRALACLAEHCTDEWQLVGFLTVG